MGSKETLAFPQEVGSPTAGLNPKGLWNQFSGKHFFIN